MIPVVHQLTLSTEERDCLVRILEMLLAGKRVEIHRTDSLSFRKELEHELEQVEAVIVKLKPTADIARAI